ncbi:membrane-spanning 4-domains subfamily A member 4D-like [Arapaima gigas]
MVDRPGEQISVIQQPHSALTAVTVTTEPVAIVTTDAPGKSSAPGQLRGAPLGGALDPRRRHSSPAQDTVVEESNKKPQRDSVKCASLMRVRDNPFVPRVSVEETRGKTPQSPFNTFNGAAMEDKTFKCDDCIVITIPLKRRHGGAQQLLPDRFHCVFKDAYKVFLKGQPKTLGTLQIVVGLLLVALGLLRMQDFPVVIIYTLPSFLFVVCGLVTYAAGQLPNVCVMKFSFSLNIISFFWALAVLVVYSIYAQQYKQSSGAEMAVGIDVMIALHLCIEMVAAVLLIYWESKAICRNHFNILPLINFKFMEDVQDVF